MTDIIPNFGKSDINYDKPPINRNANLTYYGNMPAQYTENTTSWIQWMHWMEGWVTNVFQQLTDGLNETQNNLTVTIDNINKVLDEWKKIVDNIPNEIHDQVLELASPIIEEKINQYIADNLPGIAQAAIDKVIDDYKKRIENLEYADRSNHQMNYKMMSITKYLATENDITLYQKMAAWGAECTLVPMVSVTSLTDSNPIAQSDEEIQAEIDKANQSGTPVKMFKPHIGFVTGGDTLNRHDYAPSDVDTFFAKWKSILLNSAEICKKNKIDILCIGSEQYTNITPIYKNYWEDIYQTIKSSYPDLKLTYAMSIYEFLDTGRSNMICNFVDIIGMNIYPSWTFKPIGQDDLQSTINGFYSDNGGYEYQKIADNLSFNFNKKVLITETGVTHFNESLNNPLNNTGSTDTNYDVAGKAMRALFTVLKISPTFMGFSWWNMSGQFTIFNSSGIDTLSEQVLTAYCKEDKII